MPEHSSEATESRETWNFGERVPAGEGVGLFPCGDDVPPAALVDIQKQEEELQ